MLFCFCILVFFYSNSFSVIYHTILCSSSLRNRCCFIALQLVYSYDVFLFFLNLRYFLVSVWPWYITQYYDLRNRSCFTVRQLFLFSYYSHDVVLFLHLCYFLLTLSTWHIISHNILLRVTLIVLLAKCTTTSEIVLKCRNLSLLV